MRPKAYNAPLGDHISLPGLSYELVLMGVVGKPREHILLGDEGLSSVVTWIVIYVPLEANNMLPTAATVTFCSVFAFRSVFAGIWGAEVRYRDYIHSATV